MEDASPLGDILSELKELNANERTQISMMHILKTGIIYGVGFVIGSSILAAFLINVGILLFGDYPMIHDVINFVRLR